VQVEVHIPPTKPAPVDDDTLLRILLAMQQMSHKQHKLMAPLTPQGLN
jgi:hypothetical protein